MKKVLLTLLICFTVSRTLAQCDCKNIYVWKFSDLSTKNNAMETAIADAFEEVLTARKYCVVLERRNYATIVMHEENEKRIQSIEDISNKNIVNLKAIKASIVVLATTQYDGGDVNERLINVKFVNIYTKQILANTSISKPVAELAGYEKLHRTLTDLMDKMCGEEFGITAINIQDTVKDAKGLLVDLDPLRVTWIGKGAGQQVEVCLENAETLKQTAKKIVSSTEGYLNFANTRFEDYNEILNTRFPGEKNRIRVVFFPKGQPQIVSKEFELYVGMYLALIGTDATHLEVIPLVDNTQVKAYAFKTEVFLLDHHNQIAADLKTDSASNNPKFELSANLVKTVNWDRVGIIPNCVRDGIDDRMIRTQVMVDQQRHLH